MVGGQGGVSSPSLGCGPACARVGWPYKCTVWRAMALKIGAHSCNNTTPFWLMLVWLNTTPCYPLPGDGSRSGDINTTMTCCCCCSSFFLYLHVPRGHQHHNDDDVVVVVLPLFCICTWPDQRPPPRVTTPKNNYTIIMKKNDVEVEKVVEEARGCWVSTWSLSPFENL